MDLCGDKVEFPSSKEMALLDELSDEVNILRDTKPQPDNFFDEAININETLLPIENKMATVYNNISDAVNAFHISNLCSDYYK